MYLAEISWEIYNFLACRMHARVELRAKETARSGLWREPRGPPGGWECSTSAGVRLDQAEGKPPVREHERGKWAPIHRSATAWRCNESRKQAVRFQLENRG